MKEVLLSCVIKASIIIFAIFEFILVAYIFIDTNYNSGIDGNPGAKIQIIL